ncbi:MAG: ABC transporter ATP-binding protein [Coriobacteriales bacterium]|jgi:ABC-type Fe3+/spermidine/putrescine transport system ATPase subunit|nr:ABC transporter ATP-binding protein [Coriobacteriales bacterium]
MSFLTIDGLTKTYRGNAEPTICELDLEVEQGEIVVLLGASGCGKTTTLRLIAGLEQQDRGSISIDGDCVDGLRAEKRPIAMVFQKALLFKNMTVAENIGFTPRLNRSMSRQELARRIDEMLALMRLEGLGERKVTQISGGQEQRVSLARALMTNPKLLLLDEPLSALDAELRVSMREHIRLVNRKLGTTMLFVTHDQEEALALGDRIAMMFDGRLAQYGAPEEFFTRPASRQVASFFGWKNFVKAECRLKVASCAFGRFALDCPDGVGVLAIRPEAACNIGTGVLQGVVLSATFKGTSFSYRVRIDERTLEQTSNDCEPGELELELELDSREVFSPGELLRFDLDARRMWMLV